MFHPWETATVNLFGLVAGQISNSVLPPAEKFFLGGIRYNRGFYAGEVTGDNALTASVELQLNMTVPLDWMGQTTGMSTQFYLFRDWGQTWENQKQDLNRQLRPSAPACARSRRPGSRRNSNSSPAAPAARRGARDKCSRSAATRSTGAPSRALE